MKKIYLILFSMVLIFTGCGTESIEDKTRSTFEKFDSNLKESGYVYQVAPTPDYKEKYYVTKEGEYGFEAIYDDEVVDKLNCSENGFYIIDGEDHTSELETTCSEVMEDIEKDYKDVFTKFFEDEFEAEYKEEDDFYIITGTDIFNTSYKYEIHTSGKQVIYRGSSAIYSFTILDDVELPTK